MFVIGNWICWIRIFIMPDLKGEAYSSENFTIFIREFDSTNSTIILLVMVLLHCIILAIMIISWLVIRNMYLEQKEEIPIIDLDEPNIKKLSRTQIIV